jgi:hypothetical protein
MFARGVGEEVATLATLAATFGPGLKIRCKCVVCEMQ